MQEPAVSIHQFQTPGESEEKTQFNPGFRCSSADFKIVAAEARCTGRYILQRSSLKVDVDLCSHHEQGNYSYREWYAQSNYVLGRYLCIVICTYVRSTYSASVLRPHTVVHQRMYKLPNAGASFRTEPPPVWWRCRCTRSWACQYRHAKTNWKSETEKKDEARHEVMQRGSFSFFRC